MPIQKQDATSHYEADIGIEVHVQLKTTSKIFCTSTNEALGDPNTHICPVCAGYPGVLPVVNEQVLAYAIMAALATHSTIEKESEFTRKHYFYPDLPKNYQITQHTKPLCTNGYVPIRLDDGSIKKIRLIRIHIEEDAGKSIHAPESNASFVDLNRAGTPLLEIVSHPDIKSTYEARLYLKALHLLITSLGISTGNMEEGAFRADTNVSVRKKGDHKLGTRCELKNINSFKFISDAVEYEIERQVMLLERGEKIAQETRSWDIKEHKTMSLRSKEEAADYRYFADPDLPLIRISQEQIGAIQNLMPELPYDRTERLCKTYGISQADADIIVNEPLLADYYEQIMRIAPSKHIINWVVRDVLRCIKDQKIAPTELRLTPEKLAHLVRLVDQGTITQRSAQELFAEIANSGAELEALIKERGLGQTLSSAHLEALIQEIIASSPEQVAEYKAGKQKIWGYFIGQIMKKTEGKANPVLINELLKKALQ